LRAAVRHGKHRAAPLINLNLNLNRAAGRSDPLSLPFGGYVGRARMIEPARTILVVEDDRDVREIATVVLEEAGYRVLEAESGDDAYRLLLAHPDLPIDALFTDIVMPGRLDGVDIANAARELRPGLRVLYATGFANLVRPHREDDLRGPVLRKPYRPAELRAAIHAMLERVC
jgi:CheY-like chemotaxis protein